MILYLQFIDYSDIHTLIHTVHTSGVCYDKLKMYVCHKDPDCYEKLHTFSRLDRLKVITQGKLFLRCTHLLYCSAPSLGGNVDTRQMSQPDMGSIFRIQKSMKYSGQRKLLCELLKFSKIQCFYPSPILNENYSCLQNPYREN